MKTNRYLLLGLIVCSVFFFGIKEYWRLKQTRNQQDLFSARALAGTVAGEVLDYHYQYGSWPRSMKEMETKLNISHSSTIPHALTWMTFNERSGMPVIHVVVRDVVVTREVFENESP